MTWQHLGAIFLALAALFFCGVNPKCTGESFDKMFSLSSIIIAGTLGHAGQNSKNKDAAVISEQNNKKG